MTTANTRYHFLQKHINYYLPFISQTKTAPTSDMLVSRAG